MITKFIKNTMNTRLRAIAENEHWSILLSFLKGSMKKAVTQKLKETLHIHSHKVKKKYY